MNPQHSFSWRHLRHFAVRPIRFFHNVQGVRPDPRPVRAFVNIQTFGADWGPVTWALPLLPMPLRDAAFERPARYDATTTLHY